MCGSDRLRGSTILERLSRLQSEPLGGNESRLWDRGWDPHLGRVHKYWLFATSIDSYTKMPSATETFPRPLPVCPESFPMGSDLQMAFLVCETLESEERWPPLCPDDGREPTLPALSPTRAARVLGFALLYPPSDAGRDNLTAEILGCNEDRELLAGLARLYAFGFIGFCTLLAAFCLSPC